jgi:hypothetical protein
VAGPVRIGAAAAVGVLAVVSGACRSSEDGRPAAARPTPAAGGTVVVVPGGAQVTTLTFATGASRGPVEVAPESSRGGTAAFPLLAYRRFCDVHPEDYGLVPPRLVVGLRLVDGRSEALRFGAVSFTGGGTYVLEPDSGCVALVTTSSVHQLARLAGDAAAAPFRSPADTRPAMDQEQPSPDPAAAWVDQARRAQTRSVP